MNDGAQFGDQLEHRAVIYDVCLPVQQQTSLVADRLHHARMAVPGVRYTDAAGKIQVSPPFDIVQIDPFAALNEYFAVARPDR